MRQDPKAQQIRSTSWVAAEQGVLSNIFCHGLANTALTSGPENLGHSSRQRALSRSRTAPTAARKLFVAAIDICCSRQNHGICGLPGSPGVVSWRCIFFSLPRGSSTAGAGPSWVGGALGRCLLARFGGGTVPVPPLVH
jgi:hypothetical protein